MPALGKKALEQKSYKWYLPISNAVKCHAMLNSASPTVQTSTVLIVSTSVSYLPPPTSPTRRTRSRRPPLILKHPPPPLRTPTLLKRSNQLEHLLELLVPTRLRTAVMIEMINQHTTGYHTTVGKHEIADHF